MLYIVVGLPGSGKTHLLQSLSKSYNIFDDCLSNMWNGELFDSIKQEKDTVIADPRFCDVKVFNSFVDRVKIRSIIKIILYENNPSQCKKNISNPKRHIDIENYTKIYDLDNYTGEYKIEYKKVFNKDGK